MISYSVTLQGGRDRHGPVDRHEVPLGKMEVLSSCWTVSTVVVETAGH